MALGRVPITLGRLHPRAEADPPLVACPRSLAWTMGWGEHIIRAYEKRTGEIVGEITLPAKPTGSPMSYMLGGKQYIVVAAATLESPAELIALTLP